MGSITKNENYELGSGELKLDVTIGNAHAGDTTVKLEGEIIKIALSPGNINEFAIDEIDQLADKELYIRSNVDRIEAGNKALLTIKLYDASNKSLYKYAVEFDEEAHFRIYIKCQE